MGGTPPHPLPLENSLIIINIFCEPFPQALNALNLSARRVTLCLQFAKKYVKYEKAKELYPLNTEIRNKYKVHFAIF